MKENCSPSRPLPRSANTTTKRRGVVCCVPLCKNSYRNNPELFWYVIQKDPSLRKEWLNKISRKNFNPTATHRVCSAHFVGGKKTYMNKIPTIVPNTIKPSETAARKSLNSSGVLRALPIKGNLLAGAPMEK